MRPSFLFLFLTLFLGKTLAQSDSIFPALKIGEWQQHLPWQRAVYVTQSDSKVYFATEWAVVEIDKADRSPRFLTKVDGLSDVGMNLLRYNAAAKAILMAYTNSNLDIYYPADGSVVNLPFIQKNVNIIGDKQIYDVFFEGTTAYLSCGFGVLKLDIARAEADYTVFTGVAVRAFAVFGGYLWAGTSEGVFRLPANDVNPADFSRWQMLGEAEGFPTGLTINAMCVSNGQLYFGMGKTLQRFDGTTLTQIASHPERDLYYLTAEGPGLMIAWKKGFLGSVEYLENNGNRYEIHNACGAQFPFYGIEDGTRKFWFADEDDKFNYYDHNTGQCERFAFNSPYRQTSSEIAFGAQGEVYVATPGPAPNLSIVGYREGVYRLKDGVWKRWSQATTPEIVDAEESFKDMWKVVPHPTEDKVYVGSWVGGLLEFAGGDFVRRYSKTNSILQSAGAAGSQTGIGGLVFDADQNLWISNYSAAAPIAVLKPDGTLRNFSAAPASALLQVAVDQNGYKWFVIAFNGGVLVYDSGSDLDSPSDDRYRVLTTANSNLPTNTVNCITVDLDGDVWVGTQQGVVSFECGSNVFEGTCEGRRRIVNVDGFNGYLLETEDVRTIAVDGANQKWFGTTNGVFVQSPDALTQVALYTKTNSPLLDNSITDIAINPKNGEAWIGTEKGLVSLRTEATEGGRINSLAPYAYPNPVQPGYDGPIAIYGLARDANVKITDVAGHLVYEGKALGGQAVWNGRDYLGRRAASGVYLVFATSQATFEEPDAIITKVVILN